MIESHRNDENSFLSFVSIDVRKNNELHAANNQRLSCLES